MSPTIQHDEEIGSTRFRAVRLMLRREAQLSPDLTRLESHSTTTAFLVIVQGGDGPTVRLDREELVELRDVCNETLERWTEPVEPVEFALDPNRVEPLYRPAEWCERLGVEVLDPDGWRGRDAEDWDEPISRREFDRRLATSTHRPVASSPEPKETAWDPDDDLQHDPKPDPSIVWPTPVVEPSAEPKETDQ
jgi:hypothetical protein